MNVGEVHVKLDIRGHVAGVTNAPISPEWIKPPPHVAVDPFHYRYSERALGWVRKTEPEHREFDKRHTPEHSGRDAETRVSQLEERLARLERRHDP